MISAELKSELSELVCAGDVLLEEPMSAHTTFGVGGPAECYVIPRSLEQLCAVMMACNRAGVDMRVIGLGSDLLVADAGLRCVVVQVADNLSRIQVCGERVVVQAGASNVQVARAACEAGLSGYEFAVGIPGTVGGAAIMNAGAYGGEFRDVAEGARCLTPAGEVVDVSARDAAWTYRHSMMDDADYIVLEVTLHLTADDPAAIRVRMDDFERRRAEKQPIELPSAGSTFKRPQGHFVGKLVQEAGLRGVRVGGAQVSEKHTGFVVNAGGASAEDVRRLIVEVQKRVLEHAGVHLEPEVRMWGFEE